jgi:hypothetical protein
MPLSNDELRAERDVLKRLTTYALDGWVQVRIELYAVEARIAILHDGERRVLTKSAVTEGAALAGLLDAVEARMALDDEPERDSYVQARVDRACGVRP